MSSCPVLSNDAPTHPPLPSLSGAQCFSNHPAFIVFLLVDVGVGVVIGGGGGGFFVLGFVFYFARLLACLLVFC